MVFAHKELSADVSQPTMVLIRNSRLPQHRSDTRSIGSTDWIWIFFLASYLGYDPPWRCRVISQDC